MSVGRGLFVQPDDDDGTTPVEGRRALQGILPAAGVLDGCVVSGKSGEWVYSVSAGHPVTSRGGVDGVVAGSIDGATDTPEVDAAPATGSRWDLIWVRQNDVQAADSDSLAVLGVTEGTASGSPSKPYGDVPSGALVLAEAQVAAGATGTAHANVVITQVAAPAGVRGGIVHYASTAARDAAITSPVEGMIAVTGTGASLAAWVRRGSAWEEITSASAGALTATDAGVTLTAPSRAIRQPGGVGFLYLRATRASGFGSLTGICTLPTGFRPPESVTVVGVGYGSGDLAAFLVGTDGVVGLAAPTAGFTQVRLSVSYPVG